MNSSFAAAARFDEPCHHILLIPDELLAISARSLKGLTTPWVLEENHR